MTNALSVEIGVSRTPVRDALRQLEADGLVVIRPHLGASVKSMDVKEFRDACALRLALESHAAALAAQNRTQADLQEIGIALEAMRTLTEQLMGTTQEDALMKDLMREDIRFHIGIMAAGKNDMMKKEILRLHLINRVVSGPIPAEKGRNAAAEKPHRDERRRNVLKSHETIYDAISRGDAPAAKAAMEAHIQDMVDSSMRKITRSEAGSPRELTEEELVYSA